jgi:hypothetical protein
MDYLSGSAEVNPCNLGSEYLTPACWDWLVGVEFNGTWLWVIDQFSIATEVTELANGDTPRK